MQRVHELRCVLLSGWVQAAANGHVECIKLLAEYGASFQVSNTVLILYASAAFEQEIENASEAVSGRQRRKKLFGVGAGGQIKLILTDNIVNTCYFCMCAGR